MRPSGGEAGPVVVDNTTVTTTADVPAAETSTPAASLSVAATPDVAAGEEAGTPVAVEEEEQDAAIQQIQELAAPPPPNTPPQLPRPIALVTGGTSGIGRATVCELLRRNLHDILVACREDNPDVVTDARAAFTEATHAAEKQAEGVPPPTVTFLPLELQSLPSVKDYVSRLSGMCAERGQSIALVILGAATGDLTSPDPLGVEPEMAPHGYEKTLSVNFIGHVALVRGLLTCQPECLARGARIVAVSCGRHTHAWRLDAENLDLARPGRPWHKAPPFTNPFRRGDAYNNSKAALTTWALRLDAMYAPSGRLTATVVDPGLVPGTQLLRAAGTNYDFLWQHVVSPVWAFTQRVVTPHEAAVDILDGAANVNDFPTGGVYFEGKKQGKAARQCYDTSLQKALWDATPEMMGGEVWPAAE